MGPEATIDNQQSTINNQQSRPRGFTLIELMVVMIIVGAGIGLVAPRLIDAYDGIKAAAEEQKLTDVVETVKMRSFFRQVSYTIEFRDNVLAVIDEEVRLEFEFISFPRATLTINGNGFAESGTLRYVIRGEEKVLNVGILHSPVYTFFEKTYIIELNANVETGNLKLGNASTSLCFSQFQISSFKFHCQNTRSTKCKLLLTCREGCLNVL